MNPNGPPRNHGDEIANLVYLYRRTELDPRDQAIKALREWAGNIEPKGTNE